MKSALSLYVLLISSINSLSTVVLSISAGRLNTQTGVVIPNNALLQLVNLGADGVFNSINISDGSNTGINRWTSGDDTVLDVPLIGSDFVSTRAFDLQSGADLGNGILDRLFEYDLSSLPGGTKIGLRWFPNIFASDFDNMVSQNSLLPTRYGQFTRQSVSVWGGDLWISPHSDGFYTFDPLITQHIGGDLAENTSLGDAQGIPEAQTVFCLSAGLISIIFVQRSGKTY